MMNMGVSFTDIIDTDVLAHLIYYLRMRTQPKSRQILTRKVDKYEEMRKVMSANFLARSQIG